MRILVVGAGVIGSTYAWQLAEAGHEVTMLARPGAKQALSRGIDIHCVDERTKPKKETTAVFHPGVIDGWSRPSGHELVLVTVRSQQVDALLPGLATVAGDADVRPLMSTMLGEKDGKDTPRLRRLVEVFGAAGLRPQASRDILGWLAAHYVEYLGAVGGILEAGSAAAFANSRTLVRDAILATREGLAVCRARGMDPKSAPFNLRLYALPLWLIVPLGQMQYRAANIRQFFDENIAHGMPELADQYHNVVAEGRRLGVKMPHLENFARHFNVTV